MELLIAMTLRQMKTHHFARSVLEKVVTLLVNQNMPHTHVDIDTLTSGFVLCRVTALMTCAKTLKMKIVF